MIFYKGGLTYSELNNMPLPLVIDYYNYAIKINKEREKQIKKSRRR